MLSVMEQSGEVFMLNCCSHLGKIKLFQMVIVLFLAACAEKEMSKNPSEAYKTSKEAYDDGDYEIALTTLGEFKSRFPYSQYAVEAELLIANSQFELEQYEDAAVSYSQFAKLHPRHEKLDFAMYRVGESYWMLSPDDIDREQEFTRKAIDEWQKLIDRLPSSRYSKKAKSLVKQGKRRIADSFEFVAAFYCKQEIYHACAFRYINLAREFPEFKKMRRRSLEKASKALLIISKEKKKDPKSDKNIYFSTLDSKQIVSLSKKLRDEARKVR